METQQKQAQEKDFKGKVVRILSRDIDGDMGIYSGLAKIKGVSWSLSNSACKVLKLEKRKKIGALNENEIKTISEFLKNPDIPSYLKNRRSDFETGEDKHLVGSDLELRKEFDIKRLKKIKSYRGYRHMLNLPLRGQRTRSNFRKNKSKGVGIKKKGKKR